MEGSIEQGDATKLEQVLPYANDGDFTLCLDSPGGFLEEGIRIANVIEKRGVVTLVLGGDTCLSACAVAFLGGTSTYQGDAGFYEFPTRFASMNSIVGFHAPFLQQLDSSNAKTYTTEEVREVWATSRAAARSYTKALSKRGVPTDLIIEFLAVESQELFLLDTVDRLRRMNIFVHDLPIRVPDEAVYLETCAGVLKSVEKAREDLSKEGPEGSEFRLVSLDAPTERIVNLAQLTYINHPYATWQVCRIRYAHSGSISVENCDRIMLSFPESLEIPAPGFRLLDHGQVETVGDLFGEDECETVANYSGWEAEMWKARGETLIYDRDAP